MRLVLAAFGIGALGGWVGAGLAGLGSPDIESTGAPIEVSQATSRTVRAEDVDAPRATAVGEHGVPTPQPAAASVAITSLMFGPERNETKEAPGSVEVIDTGAAAPLHPSLLRCLSQSRRPCSSRR